MDQLEWIKYPIMFPYDAFGGGVANPELAPSPLHYIVFNLNYGTLVIPKHVYESKYYTFKYRCMDCAQHLGIDWYTDEFTSNRYVLESVEKQMGEHVQNHVTFGAWGISIYRNMKEKK
jgi:hypothetical protein